MAAVMQRLYDAMVDFLASLEDGEFDALLAQARPPAEQPPEKSERRITAADARAELARRYGDRAKGVQRDA